MQFSGRYKMLGKAGLLIALIISLMMLMPRGNQSLPDDTGNNRHHSELTSASFNSVVSSGIDLCTFQRISNVQRLCFSMIYHSINPVLENKATESKIQLSFLTGLPGLNSSFYIHHYYLFFEDNDDVPPLV
jgi:hypothetical protein